MERSEVPKKRLSKNTGLPKRWAQKHGAYYYYIPPGLEHLWDGKTMFRLGKTLPEAYTEYAKRMQEHNEGKTVGEAIDRYMLQVAPAKAPKTHKENTKQAEKIRAVFGHMRFFEVKPKHIYGYVEARDAKVAAKREVALFSHVCTKAVEWGYIDKHPFKGEVRLETEKPRTRYVEDFEIVECLSLPAMQKRGSVSAIQAYIKIKLITGLRRSDLLRLRVENFREDGLHINTGKTGKSIIYAWSDELRNAVHAAKSARPVDISPHLFCNRRGQCYIKDNGTASGWDSMWQRFMKRVLKETKVTERFTEHDLRAKCASDAETLEHARQLLAHADSKITNKVYRRKPEIVRPLR